MTQYWNVQYQLVPSNMHQHDSDKRSIRTFKAHFVSILAGFSINFPSCLWDILLPKAELTIKLLRQTSNNPNLSDWAYVNGTFNYVATPFVPLGCRVMIHKKIGVRHSQYCQGKEGWSVGASLEHYRCQQVVAAETRVVQVSDTV